MIKCKVTVCGIVSREVSVRTDKEGKPFVAFGMDVVIPARNGINKTIGVSVAKDGKESDLSAYRKGSRLEVAGTLILKKRDERLYLNLSASGVNFATTEDKDFIKGKMEFRSKVGKAIDERKDRNGKDYLQFSVFSAEIAEMMIQKIEEISKDWRKPWFTAGTLTCLKNMAGREYNGFNAAMLFMHCEKQGYTIPRFCTFEAVSRMNDGKTGKDGQPLPRVSVLRGEKSFPVMLTTFTCIDKDTKEKIKYDDYKKLDEEEKKRYNVYPKMQVFRVFNIDRASVMVA